MDKDNILKVVGYDLCLGCGTCVSMCPNSAIRLLIDKKKGIYLPKLDKDKCNNCGTCYNICPGHDVDFKTLNRDIFEKEPTNILVGNYINCYIGYAVDYNVRYNAASGGLITAILVFALEKGIINGVIVTKMNKERPLEPEPFIARTREEIIDSSKSKYCPVPANVILKDILKSKDGERFAVVGLPCHIHGLRKAERINKILREKIVLRIGIICNHAPNFLATEFLLKRLRIRNDDIEKLNYRGNGWPGEMEIVTRNGHKVFIPYSSTNYWGLVFNQFFYPIRCTLCDDKICELSDISFGDAWIPGFIKNDNIGLSLVISRNKTSEEILNSAVLEHQIELKKSTEDVIVKSQSLDTVKKKLRARINIFRLFKKRVPYYHRDLLISDLFGNFLALLFYVRICFISKYPSLIVLYRSLLENIIYMKNYIEKRYSK